MEDTRTERLAEKAEKALKREARRKKALKVKRAEIKRKKEQLLPAPAYSFPTFSYEPYIDRVPVGNLRTPDIHTDLDWVSDDHPDDLAYLGETLI